MQAYQIKVLAGVTCLYGGDKVSVPNDQTGAVLMVKNDRFGEEVEIQVVTQKPTQPAQTVKVGILGRDQSISLNLQFVLRIEAKTLAPNFDSNLSCVVVQGQR